MKTLVLCRHAKSDWPEDVSDQDRPLKERGREDVVYLGKLLAGQKFLPDLIISSQAKRARHTAKLLATELGYEKEIEIQESIYYESVGSLLELIQNLPDSIEVAMIVGHNPTMEQTIRLLIQSDNTFELPTCGMACFESPSNQWSRVDIHTARLRWLLIPRFNRKDNSGEGIIFD